MLCRISYGLVRWFVDSLVGCLQGSGFVPVGLSWYHHPFTRSDVMGKCARTRYVSLLTSSRAPNYFCFHLFCLAQLPHQLRVPCACSTCFYNIVEHRNISKSDLGVQLAHKCFSGVCIDGSYFTAFAFAVFLGNNHAEVGRRPSRAVPPQTPRASYGKTAVTTKKLLIAMQSPGIQGF